MSPISDMSLVTQVVLFGSREAFDTLVKRHQGSVRRLFMQLTLGDGMLSDDLAQDTFVKAWLSLPSFKGLANFQTWLFRIAYNIFYDYIRTRKETTTLEGVTDGDPSDVPGDVGRHMDVYRALAQLNEAERVCVTLFYLEDLPTAIVSRITGMKIGTVKSHLSRGRYKMAVFLQQNGYENKEE